MRYLCMVCFSYAAATLFCAYWLSPDWLLPLGSLLLGIGIGCILLRRRYQAKWLLRITLCALSAALALGAYTIHLRRTVAPARALHGTVAAAQVELREPPRSGAYNLRALAWLHLNNERYSVQLWLDEADGLLPGDVLSGTFRLELPSEELEDGQEPGYLRSCGVYLTAEPTAEAALTRPARLPLRHWPAMLRLRITEVCWEVFDSDTAPWFIALLTNQNEHISYAERNDLKLAGLYHCLCTSGMHIHVLLGLISLLCLHNRRRAALIGLPLCLFFWGVAGGTPSVSRAVVMQALLLLAPLLRQAHDTPTSMALALGLSLIVHPDSIAHLGLQLSYLSVAGIALFALPIYQWGMNLRPAQRLSRFRAVHWLLSALMSSLSTALGAMLLTTPLLAAHYGVVSLIAPLAGLPVLPLVTVCFALGLPLTLLIALCPALGILALPLDWLMGWVIALTRFFADFPALYVTTPYSVVWLVLCYALVALLRFARPPVWLALSGIVLSLCLALGLQHRELRRARSDFRLTALDVGQGQCLIAELDSRVCVIDCGGSYPEDAGERCARWLLQNGYHRIDLLALTHYDADHAGGAAQLLSRIEAGTLLLPDTADESGLRAILTATDTPITWITEDTQITLGEGCLTAYAPRAESGDNEASLAFLLTRGTQDVLVPGDMDRGSELRLCKTAALPDVEVFVAGHHGSRDSNSETLLRRTAPELVIVSASGRYGHPHAESLQRFAAIGAAVVRTDEYGTVSVQIGE